MGITVQVVERGRNAPQYRFSRDLTGTLTLQQFTNFTKNALIDIAKTVLKEEQAKGFDKKPRVRVDNSFRKREEEVFPFGRITYFERVDFSLALLKMYKVIVERSPLVTGQYRSGNLVFVNGVEVARSMGSLRRYVVTKSSEGGFKENDEIRFVNVNAYARRLENKGIRRGVRGRFANKNQNAGRRSRKSRKTGNLIQQPNGAYYLSYRVIRRQFKQVAQFLKFTYMPNGTNGIRIRGGAGQRTEFKKDGRPYLYPSIVLRLAGAGIRREQIFE